MTEARVNEDLRQAWASRDRLDAIDPAPRAVLLHLLTLPDRQRLEDRPRGYIQRAKALERAALRRAVG